MAHSPTNSAATRPQSRVASAAAKQRRLVALLTCGLLAVFAGTGVARLEADRRALDSNGAEAQILAARGAVEAVNFKLAHAWGVLVGAAELARQSDTLTQSPQAAANAAAEADSVAGVAIFTASGAVLASTSPAILDVARAARAAAGNATSWKGVAGPSGKPARLALVRRAGSAVLVSVMNSERLLPVPTKGAMIVLAATDGRLLAALPEVKTAPADAAALLGLSAKQLSAAKPVAIGKDPTGARLAIGAASASVADLRLYVAKPRATPIAGIADLLAHALILFGAPILAALALLRLWLNQSRKTEIAEAEMRRAQRRLRLAASGADSGVFEWRLESDEIELSERLRQMTGAPALISRMEFLNLVGDEDRAETADRLAMAQETGTLEAAFRVRGQNGITWIEVRGLMLQDPTGEEPPRIVGTALDVTPRREAEARSAALERRLREAIDSYSGPFALFDQRKKLVMCNRSYARDFNLPPALQKPGALYDNVLTAAHKEIRLARPDLDDTHIQEIELSTGVWLNLVERRTAEGGIVVVGVDITALKRQEEALMRSQRNLRSMVAQLELSESRNRELAKSYEAEKHRAEDANRAKSAFLANMSHELRTPLNAINGFSEIMASELLGPIGHKRYQEYSKDILASGQLLLDLINDILDMAKIEAGKMTLAPRPLAPVEAIDGAVRLMRRRAEEKGLHVMIDAPDLPEIEADHRAVKQMLLNLLSNAVKFTQTGGVMVRARATDEDIVISVIDTGVGIAKHHIPRLGRPFEQIDMEHSKQHAGTGLGLALTKTLAEMHGGRLEIESELGKGTVVAIRLPRVAKRAPLAA